MERKVVIGPWQKVTEEDFNNFGKFPQESLDHALMDIGPSWGFTGFQAVQSAAAEVTVGNGRLYDNAGRVFFNDTEGGVPVDMLQQLPAVNRRYIAIVAWGTEVSANVEPRTFLTDATTRTTQAQTVATERRRWANVAAVAGLEAPDPLIPAVPANNLAIAYVLLDVEGVVSITVPDENRAPSLREVDSRLNENDAWRVGVGTQIDTLRTDLASLAARLRNTVDYNTIIAGFRDISIIKEQLTIPDDYTAWAADHFLTTDESDTAHVDFLCKVEEGARFPHAAERDAQLSLLNQYEERVIQQDFFLLPRYVETPRLSVLGNDAELSISNFEQQTVNWVQKTRARSRIRYGTAYEVCTNNRAWWAGGVYIAEGIFRRFNGEVFQVGASLGGHNNNAKWRRVTQMFEDSWEEAYWDSIIIEESFAGALISQTFLNSQDGWLTSLDLFFTRVAAAGDVQVRICETGENGQPLFNKVIGKAVIQAANLRTFPTHTKANFVPVFLEKGRRYAICLQTPGNHYVALVIGNKFGQGSLFQSSDGAWQVGDLLRDMTFRANFARFDLPRVEIQMQPLELNGGIANIDINVDQIAPAGTAIIHEIQVAGEWKPLQFYEESILVGLPPLLPYRIVFLGTTDVMPGVGVGVNSRLYTWRQRSDFKHISTVRTLPAPCNTIHVDLRLEAWRGAPYHTNVVKILTGVGYATVETADVTEDQVAHDDPNALERRVTFSLAAPVSSYKIRIEGTTDNVLTPFHVAERVDVALTV